MSEPLHEPFGTPAGSALVAPREDSTTATSGIALVQTGGALLDAIESGSWRDGALAGSGLAIGVAAAVLDPLGALVAAGAGWLMEHVQPLSDLLDQLAGDPDAVAAQARTWRNVAAAVRAAGDDLQRAAAPAADWTGDAADAFTRAGAARAAEVRAAALVADALGAAVDGAGTAVSFVREVVRELIAQLVATLVARLPQWTLEEVGTLGIATPHVVAAASAVIAKVTHQVVNLVDGLTRSLRALGDIVGDVLDLARRLFTTAPHPAPPTPAPTVTTRALPDPALTPARGVEDPGHPFGPGTGGRSALAEPPTTLTGPVDPARSPGLRPTAAPPATTPTAGPPARPPDDLSGVGRIRAALEPHGPPAGRAPLPLGEGLAPVAPGTRTLLDRLPETRVTRGADGLIERIDGRPYRDAVRDLARRRAEEFRVAQAARELSARRVGNAVTVAVDRRSGRLVEATNERQGTIIEDLHPTLRQRYEKLVTEGPYPAFERDGSRVLDGEGRPAFREHPHPDHPLRHSEVKAVDHLLHGRGADVDRGTLAELAVDTFFPFEAGGVRTAPSCANCTAMIGEADSISGKLIGFPTSFDRQRP